MLVMVTVVVSFPSSGLDAWAKFKATAAKPKHNERTKSIAIGCLQQQQRSDNDFGKHANGANLDSIEELSSP